MPAGSSSARAGLLDSDIILKVDGKKVTNADEQLLRSQWPTPGDYMHDIIHANQGDLAAQQRVQRALQNSVTGDMPGIVPEPIVGDVINIIDASRPLVTAQNAQARVQMSPRIMNVAVP